jgi:hypothetical protein
MGAPPPTDRAKQEPDHSLFARRFSQLALFPLIASTGSIVTDSFLLRVVISRLRSIILGHVFEGE